MWQVGPTEELILMVYHYNYSLGKYTAKFYLTNDTRCGQKQLF